jgi:hypothetical protein
LAEDPAIIGGDGAGRWNSCPTCPEPKFEVPDMRGFSQRNLKYMRSLMQAWPEGQIRAEPAAQLPWFHLSTLLHMVKDSKRGSAYAGKTHEHGWPRHVLTMQIKTALCASRQCRDEF